MDFLKKNWKIIGALLGVLGIATSVYFLSPKEPRLSAAPSLNSIDANWNTKQNLTADNILNAYLDYVASVIATRQDEYFNLHGRYFQGLKTHANPPTYGVKTLSDNLSVKPHYQKEQWGDMLDLSAVSLPVSIEINQYVNWKGEQGYQLVFKVSKNNQIWIKAIATGSEASWKTANWSLEK